MKVAACYLLAKADANECLAPQSGAAAAPLLIFAFGSSSVIGVDGWVHCLLLAAAAAAGGAGALTQDQF